MQSYLSRKGLSFSFNGSLSCNEMVSFRYWSYMVAIRVEHLASRRRFVSIQFLAASSWSSWVKFAVLHMSLVCKKIFFLLSVHYLASAQIIPRRGRDFCARTCNRRDARTRNTSPSGKKVRERDANTTPLVRRRSCTYLTSPKGTQTQHVQIFFQSSTLDL